MPHDGNISDEHQVSECFSEHCQHGKSIRDWDLAVSGRGSILLESSKLSCVYSFGFWQCMFVLPVSKEP